MSFPHSTPTPCVAGATNVRHPPSTALSCPTATPTRPTHTWLKTALFRAIYPYETSTLKVYPRLLLRFHANSATYALRMRGTRGFIFVNNVRRCSDVSICHVAAASYGIAAVFVVNAGCRLARFKGRWPEKPGVALLRVRRRTDMPAAGQASTDSDSARINLENQPWHRRPECHRSRSVQW